VFRSCFRQAAPSGGSAQGVVIGFLVSVTTYFGTFISVWCFFAAAGSGVLYFYFRSAAPPVSRLNPSP
jgi:hypothetical protein